MEPTHPPPPTEPYRYNLKSPAMNAANLSKLASDVDQFTQAIRHANQGIDNLIPKPKSINQTPDTPVGGPIGGDNDLAAQLNAAIANGDTAETLQKRRAYEEMRRMWLEWGAGVMRTLEAWMGRQDVGIADRVMVMCLADRMARFMEPAEDGREGGK